MKKYITILVSSLIIISGGCNNAEKEANKRLEQARINLENNDFFAARNEIDSIRKFYPKEYKILKEALTVMRQIDIKEAKRNIAYCDSLLPIRQQELENMKTGEKIEGALAKDFYKGSPIIPVTKPYFYGWVGSLEIGLVKGDKVVPIGYLSGLTDDIKSRPLDFKGKVIEISCMEILPTGGLRHAKFVQFRDDLTIRDATWEKVFG